MKNKRKVKAERQTLHLDAIQPRDTNFLLVNLRQIKELIKDVLFRRKIESALNKTENWVPTTLSYAKPMKDSMPEKATSPNSHFTK